MSNFRVGQKVVCIADSTMVVNDLGLPGFKKGQIFTISGVFTMEPFGLMLRFHERDWRNTASHKGFRPVVERKTDISIFKAMLDPSKAKEAAE